MRVRKLDIQVRELLDSTPAVVLIGSRQVGKTTLAREIGDERDAVYLDLESPSDRAKLEPVFKDENELGFRSTGTLSSCW